MLKEFYYFLRQAGMCVGESIPPEKTNVLGPTDDKYQYLHVRT